MSQSKHEKKKIQIFLKVKESQVVDIKYYHIDPEKHIFTLYDQLIKAPSDKSQIFEMDKLFTDSHENSYIYEEICRNCITESLKGENYSYISYGDTSSDKFNIVLGTIEESYNNISKRGILPRLIEAYLETISSNENLSHNLSLSMSYICLKDTKMIDLSTYMGKDISSLSEDDLYNSGIEVKIGNKSTINSIKRVLTENINDVLFFLNKIIGLFRQIEPDSKYKLYSRSHFIFIIYITDNNGTNISTITFIILMGNEQIFKEKGKIEMSGNRGVDTKNQVQASKNLINIQFSFDSVINAIENNNSICMGSEIKDEDEEKEKINFSRLTTVLYYACFSPFINHIKFRIIGTIFPTTGYYSNVQNTLMFLFSCKKIIRKNYKISIEDKKSKSEKSHHQIESNDFKNDDIIFDLESRLKTQEKIINELKAKIENKESKIRNLEINYKKQVEVLKEQLGFNGDVNILLSKDQYSKEARLARNIREAVDNVRIKSNLIKELENKIKELKEEIMKMTTQNNIRKNDMTMAQIYTQIKDSNETKDLEFRLRNQFFAEIEELKKKNSRLEKIVKELEKENDTKAKIIHDFPKVIQNKTNENFNINKIKEEEMKSCEHKIKKEFNKMLKAKDIEIQTTKEEYENILKQKELQIKNLTYSLNDLKKNLDSEIQGYSDELLKLDEIFIGIIKNFKLFSQERKSYFAYETLEKAINSAEENVNGAVFPLLYKSLYKYNKFISRVASNQGIKRNSTSLSKTSKKGGKIKPNEINKIAKSYSLNQTRLKSPKKNDSPPPEKLQKVIKDNKKEITKEQLDIMTKDSLVDLVLEMNMKVDLIEDFANKYSKYKKGFNVKEFALNEENSNMLYMRINKLENEVKEKVEINNKNKMIINSQERTINQLRLEHEVMKSKLKSKSLNEQISYPLFTKNEYTSVRTSANGVESENNQYSGENMSENSTTRGKLINEKTNKNHPVIIKSKKVNLNDFTNNAFSTNKRNITRPLTAGTLAPGRIITK